MRHYPRAYETHAPLFELHDDIWLREERSHLRHPGYEPGALLSELSRLNIIPHGNKGDVIVQIGAPTSDRTKFAGSSDRCYDHTSSRRIKMVPDLGIAPRHP